MTQEHTPTSQTGMTASLQYDFDLRPDDGNDLHVTIEKDGITIRDVPYRDDGTTASHGTGYVTIRHNQMEAIMHAVENFKTAAKTLVVEIKCEE